MRIKKFGEKKATSHLCYTLPETKLKTQSENSSEKVIVDLLVEILDQS